jgi:trk system potassium uptake protein TrkA
MRIIIVGCGRMGAGLAQRLSVHGHSVAIVDHNPAAFDRLGPTFHGRTIVGGGFDRAALLHAGIERADGLAAVTSSDDVNVVAARLARRVFRVPRVIARLYDPRKAELYRRLDVQTISTTGWGISRIAELLTYSHLDPIVSLGAGEVDLVEAEIPPAVAGRTIQDVMVPGEVQVVAIHRAGTTFLPAPTTVFQAGDLAYLVLLASSAERLRTLLSLT